MAHNYLQLKTVQLFHLKSVEVSKLFCEHSRQLLFIRGCEIVPKANHGRIFNQTFLVLFQQEQGLGSADLRAGNSPQQPRGSRKRH